MTDVSSFGFGSKDHRDEKLAPILSHLYGHPIPDQALDRAILPSITQTRAVPRLRAQGFLSRFPRYQRVAGLALVAAVVAVLIGSSILPNSAPPSFASALTILRHSAAALAPAPGTVTHREYSLRVPCAGGFRCPDAVGEVWIANLKGTLLTYQVMRLRDVNGAASLPVAKHTSTVLPGRQGGGSTIATLAPTAWLQSIRAQLGWRKNIEPSEYLQAWSSLAEFSDYGAMTAQSIKQVLKGAERSGKVRRVNFDGAASYQLRLPEPFPQATSAAVRTLYVDARSYAIRGLEGLTCPVFGKTYSGPSFRYWVPTGCVQPRFVPKCFVNVGSGATYVWVPRGCPTKLAPFQAVLAESRTFGVCQAPRWVFGWYIRNHGGYSRCSGGKQTAAATGQGAEPGSGQAMATEPPVGAWDVASQPVAATTPAASASTQDPRLLVSGWPQPRFNAARTAFDPLSNVLTPATVSHLRLNWRKAQRYFNNLDLVAANGLLYQGGTDGASFVATSLDTHAVRWRFVPGGFALSSPTSSPQYVYAPAPAALYALDPQTGKPEWSFFPPRHGVVSGTPIVSGSIVIAPVCPPRGDESKYVPHPCSLYALSVSTGHALRVYSDPDGVTPAISGGTLYLTVQGTVRAVQMAAGRPMWTFDPAVGAQGQFHDAGSDVAVSGGIVYAAGDSSDTVYALDATTGRELWWFRAGLRHGQLTDAAIAYGHVFVGQIGLGRKAGLYCLSGRTGRVLWQFKDNNGFETGPSVTNGIVYAADPVGSIFALRASDGRRLWSATVVKPRGNISTVASDPIVANGLLLVDRLPRGVFAYGLPTH